jgi:hypothetical protein
MIESDLMETLRHIRRSAAVGILLLLFIVVYEPPVSAFSWIAYGFVVVMLIAIWWVSRKELVRNTHDQKKD